MCQIVPVAALQHETFELLEEETNNRMVSHTCASQLEQSWESGAEEYNTDYYEEILMLLEER
jgi:hypothetical protein